MNFTEILENLSNDFFRYNTEEEIQGLLSYGNIDNTVLETKWLGFDPATLENIEAQEKKLGCLLPPSYKDFLLTSNGFKYISPFLDNLLPIEQVDWVKNTEEPWFLEMIEDDDSEISDEQYFVYGEKQDTINCRDEYLLHSLKVSEWFDGMCIFLNPVVKHGAEWEVLKYATWYPGTVRYRSFKDFLTESHKGNIHLIEGE